jgi:LPS export ABC transporter protein LptC
MWWMRWVVWVAAVLALVVSPSGVPPVTSGAAPSPPPGTTPDLTLRQIHMIETRGGAKLWELRADRAEVREGEGYAVLSRVARPVEIALYASQGQLTSTAGRVTVNLKSKDLWLEGGVVARSDHGTELRSETLRWIAASRRLQTDQPVTVVRGNLLSKGRGLEAETDLERIRIFRNVTSQLRSGSWEPAPTTQPASRKAAP